MQPYYSLGQIAKILNVSRNIVQEWIDTKKLEAFQLPGGISRITRENLIIFMNNHSISMELLDNRNQANVRVVIVDDEKDILKLLAESLETTGTCRVMTAASGFEAGLIIKHFRPHVVVLDIKLKDADGREICSLIRRQSDLNKTKMIGISGKISEKEEKKILEQGFHGYLRKPFDITEFNDTVLSTSYGL